MATYKDDLDIIKAAEGDNKSMTLNAITELDNKGLLGKYGGGSRSTETVTVQFNNTTSDVDTGVHFIQIKSDSDNILEATGVNLGHGVSTTIDDIVINSVISCANPNATFSNPTGEIVIMSDLAKAVVSGDGTIDIIKQENPK